MRIRNFQAESMTEALRQVKKELGPEAVILKTTAGKPAGHRSGDKQRTFQVTACADPDGLSLPRDRGLNRRHSSTDGMESGTVTASLRSIQRDLRHLIGMGRRLTGTSQIDKRLVPYFCEMTDAGVDSGLAEKLLSSIEIGEMNSAQDHDVREAIARRMISGISAPLEIKHYANRASSVALIGAPGVGKSSLTAKLASHLLADRKMTVALATLDDFRPLARDEMQRFADALNVPCVSGAWDEIDDPAGRVILIDTPGVSVGSEKDLDLLGSRLDRAGVTEVHLVMPAYCGSREFVEWFDFFAPVGLTAVAVTNLDQVSSTGSIVTLCLSRDVRLSYTSSGRMSSKHIQLADPTKLALDVVGVAESEK
jgi:flagellar biosynthesis protein FlhF